MSTKSCNISETVQGYYDGVIENSIRIEIYSGIARFSLR